MTTEEFGKHFNAEVIDVRSKYEYDTARQDAVSVPLTTGLATRF